MHCEDLDDEPEEVIKVIQPKKAPKKKTIVLEAISDSEEEIIVRKKNQSKLFLGLKLLSLEKKVFSY